MGGAANVTYCELSHTACTNLAYLRSRVAKEPNSEVKEVLIQVEGAYFEQWKHARVPKHDGTATCGRAAARHERNRRTARLENNRDSKLYGLHSNALAVPKAFGKVRVSIINTAGGSARSANRRWLLAKPGP